MKRPTMERRTFAQQHDQGKNTEAQDGENDACNGEAFAHVADVTQEAHCRGAVDATLKRYGRLDCLDNNVGRSAPGDVTAMSLEEWRSMFALNVDSMMLMCKYAIPAMIANGGGAIVNIGPCAVSVHNIRPSTRSPRAP